MGTGRAVPGESPSVVFPASAGCSRTEPWRPVRPAPGAFPRVPRAALAPSASSEPSAPLTASPPGALGLGCVLSRGRRGWTRRRRLSLPGAPPSEVEAFSADRAMGATWSAAPRPPCLSSPRGLSREPTGLPQRDTRQGLCVCAEAGPAAELGASGPRWANAARCPEKGTPAPRPHSGTGSSTVRRRGGHRPWLPAQP